MPLVLNSIPQKSKIIFFSGFCDDIVYCVEHDDEKHDVLISLEKCRYETNGEGDYVAVEPSIPVLTLSVDRMVTNFNVTWQEPLPQAQELIDWIMYNIRQSVMSMSNWRGMESMPHAHYYDLLFAHPHVEDPAFVDVQEHLELHQYQLFSSTSIN